MLTGTLPFGRIAGSEVVFKVVGGGKPSKPTDALELGLSDKVWELLEECWQSDRTARPSVKDVSSRVKVAASICGTLFPVGAYPNIMRTLIQSSPSSVGNLPTQVMYKFIGFRRSIVP